MVDGGCLDAIAAGPVEAGGVSDVEMRRTFNCGVGMVIAVEASDADSVLARLTASGEAPFVIGRLRAA